MKLHKSIPGWAWALGAGIFAGILIGLQFRNFLTLPFAWLLYIAFVAWLGWYTASIACPAAPT